MSFDVTHAASYRIRDQTGIHPGVFGQSEVFSDTSGGKTLSAMAVYHHHVIADDSFRPYVAVAPSGREHVALTEAADRAS